MKRTRIVFLSFVLIGAALAAWSFYFEPRSLTLRSYRLDVPHWHADLAGLRGAVLADLHVGSPHSGLDKLREIVSRTNAAKPDLVLLPGDFVIQEVIGGRFVAPEQFAPVLAQLSAPLGVWATLGNHDWELDAKRVRAALEKNGIGVLDDKAVRVGRDTRAVWLVGLADFWEGTPQPAQAMRSVTGGAPALVFTHNPDIFPHVRERFSLLVAGHTHGGQVALPLLGRMVVPSQYGERYAIGHIVEEGRHLFVSSGIGTSILPVRFRVPPEVSILELHPESR